MTEAGYDAVIETHARPYILDIPSGGGELLIYGAEHTRDPSDPQIQDIRERWAEFHPSVALVEGRMGFLPPFGVDPVERFGESGAVYALARAAQVPLYTWELPLEREISAGLELQSRERVALFFVLRPYFGQVRFGRPSDPESSVESSRKKRTRWPGLEDSLADVAAIDALWKQDFPALPDWRDTSDRERLPGYLGDIAARLNARRDEHFARTLIDLVGRGQRVFAVAGSSHPVRLEPALRGALRDGR
jgi:hypothetical protein